MIDSHLPSLALQSIAGAMAGVLLGFGYFKALWWNVTLLDRGETKSALLLFGARFVILAGAFFLLARLGALPLLAGAAGLLAARRALMRRLGGAP